MLPVNYKVALEELKESGYIRNDYLKERLYYESINTYISFFIHIKNDIFYMTKLIALNWQNPENRRKN